MARMASGKHAFGISDRSGFRYRLRDMRKEWNGMLVGRDEYEAKHPQLHPNKVVADAQALRDARPDTAKETSAFSVLTNVGAGIIGFTLDSNLEATGAVGTVTITSTLASDDSDASSSTTSVTVSPTGVQGTSAVGDETASGTGLAATYTVSVASYYGSNKYYIDSSRQATLNLSEGSTYRFDQSDSSNSGHPLRFSTTSDGTHGGGSEYTTGVTTNGTPGSSGAYTQITVASGAPTLYYYCTNHSGMGGTANTP